MSEPERSQTQYHAIPRKPLPNRSSPSLRIARSHSTLWRPWSPRLGSTSEYERSLHKFPWLAHDVEYGNGYDDLEGYAPVPELSHPDEFDARLIPTVMEGEQMRSQHGDISEVSDDPIDPNLVREPSFSIRYHGLNADLGTNSWDR